MFRPPRSFGKPPTHKPELDHVPRPIGMMQQPRDAPPERKYVHLIDTSMERVEILHFLRHVYWIWLRCDHVEPP